MCFTSSIAYKCSTCNYSYIECARDSKKRMALVMRWLDWRLETEHILISLSKRSRMSLNPLLIDNGKPQVIFAPGGDTYGLNGDLALWCQRVVYDFDNFVVLITAIVFHCPSFLPSFKGYLVVRGCFTLNCF